MKSKSRSLKKPIRSSAVPATAGMLYEMEERLSNRIEATAHDLKSDLSGVKSDISGIKAELHRVALLVEDQNAKNNYVLDGYAQIYDLIKSRNP